MHAALPLAGDPPREDGYYAVGILPPSDLSAELHAHRARHDPRFATRTFPHLTLKQPFRLRAERTRLDEALRAAASATAPFAVSLTRPAVLSVFDMRSVVLDAEPGPRLLTLQRRLVLALAGFAEHLEPYHPAEEIALYRPHVTIAQHLAPPEFERVWTALAPVLRPARFLAVSLTLARCAPDGVWRVVGQYAFPEIGPGATLNQVAGFAAGLLPAPAAVVTLGADAE